MPKFFNVKSLETSNGITLSGVVVHNGRGDKPHFILGHSDSLDDYKSDITYTNFGNNTLDALPNAENYGDVPASKDMAMKKRPTLQELRVLEMADQASAAEAAEQAAQAAEETAKKPKGKHVKFGWIKGVLIRCVLNIFGVMLFLRLPWVTAQAGIGLACIIVLLASLVTVITALSMSAICTNGEIRGGGAYFLISRSLGPEFGGAIGVIFAFANAVAVAMYVVGFAETVRNILKDNDQLMVDDTNDVRIIGVITIIILLLIVILGGMALETATQIVLLVVLVVAIFNVFIGTIIPSSAAQKREGDFGYSGELFVENFGPDFRDGYGFFQVFAVYFPAATGILAGANISGDLKDPESALPKGTLLAIFLTTLVYLAVCIISGCVMKRDWGPLPNIDAAIGLVNDTMSNMTSMMGLLNNTTPMDTTTGTTMMAATGTTMMFNTTLPEIVEGIPPCIATRTCQYGIHNDMTVTQLISAYAPITIAGIFCATLSSALASLVSAPKIFQAVCKDKIFPGIEIFGKDYGKSHEPRRSYILAFIIAIAFTIIAELNAIAPLISNFFLITYGLINYACFDGSISNTPGWRPAFKYYSASVALFGAILCTVVMFIMEWITALVTFGVVGVLYLYCYYRKPDVNWGSSTQAHAFRNALQHTVKLVTVSDHIKNFRPQILAMTGLPQDRQTLMDFANSITKNYGVLICGHVFVNDASEGFQDQRHLANTVTNFMLRSKVKGFYTPVVAPSIRKGAQALLQCGGLGRLRPNTFLVGYKGNWMSSDAAEVTDYFHMIQDAFDMHYAVGIFRIKDGLDFSSLTQPKDRELCKSVSYTSSSTTSTPGVANKAFSYDNLGSSSTASFANQVSTFADAVSYVDRLDGKLNPDELRKQRIMNMYRAKQSNGTIDVWWLFDDGGLTILIPYILSQRKKWSGCTLRIFGVGTKESELDNDQKNLAALLARFRIKYTNLTMIPSIGRMPTEEHRKEFDDMVKPYLLDTASGETEETNPLKITAAELEANKERSFRQIRIRELLQHHSKDATMVILTLPVPRKRSGSPYLYMAWLETLTKDMPPILLLRGNQESVLTFYS